MSKLLAVGCSITHGTDAVESGYNLVNVDFSYARYVADYFQADYTNVAFPGASNELIFHRAVEHLKSDNYTHCVIGWTSLHREAWEKDNVVWRFNINYGEYTNINSSELPFLINKAGVSLRSNSKITLADVQRYWETINIKLLNDNLEQKLAHYRNLLQLLCKHNNIKLIEVNALPNGLTDLVNLDAAGNWLQQGRHPTTEEHSQIAQIVIKHYEKT